MIPKIDLNGKRALITGAGSGIGRAMALRLAEDGMKLALVGRDARKLMETAALTGRPLEMLVLPADLTKDRAIEDIAHIIEGHFKGLDVLVNNAGMALNQPFGETSTEDACELLVAEMQNLTIAGLTGEMDWEANGEVTKTPMAVKIENGVYVGM